MLAPSALLATVAGDEHWDPQFGPVGANDTLQALAVNGQAVFVGGNLTAAGNTRANYVAGFDGTRWYALNKGISGVPGSTFIWALAADGSNLYAGGWFTNADGSGAKYIARWDGESWSPLGSGTAGIVSALRVVDSNVYVGGYFTTAGGLTVNGIARWDGSNWSALGGGITGGSQPYVSAIESDGTNLYVGGTFTSAGGVNATNIARWNGSTWSALGSGLSGPVRALLFKSNTLYVGGSFTNRTSVNLTNLAAWDGNTWSAWATAAGTVRDLVSSGANIYAGGDFVSVSGTSASRVAKWNGSSWSALGAGIQGFGISGQMGVYRLAVDSAGRLYAAGAFNIAGTVGASHVAGWDGTNWFALGGTTSKGMTHYNRAVNCFASDGTNLYAGGIFTEASSTLVNEIAKWNGTNWTALGSGVVGNGNVYALAVTGAVVYAGGSFTNIGGVAAKQVAKWDGNSWSALGNGFNGTVKALALHRGVLFAGGSFTARGDAGADFHGIAQFDGSDWTGVPVISSWRINNSFNALVSDGINLYVGGDFYIGWGFAPPNPTLGADLDYVGRWDGTNWWSLGAEFNAAVNALAIQNGSLCAGGAFTTSYTGGITEQRIARWNGSAWATVGNGFTNGSVLALAATPTALYAAGSFTNAANQVFGQIAKWDGANWSALGSGLLMTPSAPSGYALALLGNDLYLGGLFIFAGDKPAMFISRWNDQINFYPTPNLNLTRSRWLTNGQFQCRIAGTSGEIYVIQGSTNLSDWTPLLSNTVPLYDFADTNAATFPKRYYRALLGQ